MTILDYCLIYCLASGVISAAFLWAGQTMLERNESPEAATMNDFINNNKLTFFLVGLLLWPFFFLKGLYMLLSR